MERECHTLQDSSNGEEDGNNGWQTVHRRSKKVHKPNSTTTYFFTNIPPGWNDIALWKLFAKYGRISDVYIAKKTSKTDKKFGFARFLNVSNPSSFETTLSSITIGTHRLTINIARYQNKHGNTNSHHLTSKQQSFKPTFNHCSPQNHPTTINNSYASILRGQEPPKQPPAPPTPLIIHSCPGLVNSLAHSLIGKLFTIDTFTNLHSIFGENGIPHIRQKYLEGFHTLIELDNETKTDTILSNPTLTRCFKSLKPWDSNFHLPNRLTWISIEGLPPQAWHEEAFTCIAGVWGEVVFPEKCNPNKNNLVAGKVCLRTKHMEYIQANMPVLINGVHVCIRIRELLGECDDICRSETPISSPNSKTDQDSVNNPDEHDQSNEACDDLDFFDGGSDDELFINKCQKEYFEGGGWIPTNYGEINYDSERTISDSQMEFILNIPVNSHGTSPVTASKHKRKSQDS
ncbi:RNA-directed DNA polymerase, eukaryota [Tanacetum coccineum]